MPLQTGTWSINVSGRPSTLQITAVDALGNVTANFGGASVLGFWDEDAQKLLLRVVSAVDLEIFVGYLFTDPVNLMGVTGSVIFTLAGEVEVLSSATLPTTAKRSTFGWYAQIGVE